MSRRTDAVSTVLARNEFYRDRYRGLLQLTVLLIAVMGTALVCAGIILMTKPEPIYFAVRQEGTIIPLAPLSSQHPTNAKGDYTADMLNWTTEAVRQTNTYNYLDYRERFMDAQGYFLPSAWADYESEIKRTRVLDTVRANKMIVVGEVTGAAQILKYDVVDGIYQWQIQFPMTVKYITNESQQSIPQRVTVVVRRRSLVDNPAGLGVAQIISEQQ